MIEKRDKRQLEGNVVKPSIKLSTVLTVSVSLLALSGAAYLGTATVRQWSQPTSAYAAPLSDQLDQVISGNTIPNLVARANPAVVEITDTAPAPSSTGSGTTSAEYLGSGFIISSSGYIVTNDHVINQAKDIRVKLVGTPLPVTAKVVGADYDLDLAVLKVSVHRSLPTLSLATYRSIRVGQYAVAIGNPEALSHSVTLGIISAEDRAIQAGNSAGTQVRQYYNMLQTDAAINPGNSGGPLLNLAGQVVGVNTAVSTEGEGLGFAIPVSTLRHALPYLEAGKTVPEPYLGVAITDTTQAQAAHLHMQADMGAYVDEVMAKSPAALAGVKVGEVITKFNGTPIYEDTDLLNAVQSTVPGEKVSLTVWNATGAHVLHVTMRQMPADFSVTGG
jgi:S1-C subfamily serine protease